VSSRGALDADADQGYVLHMQAGRIGGRAAIPLAILAAVAFVGCGGGGGAGPVVEGGSGAVRALRATTNTVRFTADQTIPGSALAEVARQIDESVALQQEIRTYLDALANSPDPYGRLLTRALCTGMEQVKDFPEGDTPTDEEWADFLVAQISILAPNNPIDVIQAKVNGFTTTAQLSQVNPRAAAIYFRECVARPR
jgi:hypothetical protein